MIDLLDAKKVDFTVDSFGKCWLNIDDKCTVRIGHANLVLSDDPVRGQDVVFSDDDNEFYKNRDQTNPPPPISQPMFSVFRYRSGEQKTFIAVFVSRADAEEYANEFIAGDNTHYSIEERK